MSEAPLSEADGLAIEFKQTMDRLVEIAKKIHELDGTTILLQGAQVGFVHNVHMGVKITAHRQRQL